MTHTGPESDPQTTEVADTSGAAEWTGSTVRSRDGSKLGTLVEVLPGTGGIRNRWGVIRSTLGRRRLVPLEGAHDDGIGDLSIAADAKDVRAAPVLDGPTQADPAATTELATAALQRHYTGRGVLADARALQHERYGGSKIGSAFFGWLVAVGLTVLLGVLSGVVSAALGVPEARVGLVTVAVVVVAYFAGGYVAGRLARFDGARNGFLTWVVGVLASALLALVGVFVGAQYDVLSQVALPTLPTSLDQVTGNAILVLAVAVVGTLLAAVLGGRAGEGYHRRVDRAAADAV